jgi:hypothetical protein
MWKYFMADTLLRYTTKVIKWRVTDNALFPFKAIMKGDELKIGVNDFPNEPMYSLYINGNKISDFNSWPILCKKQ